MEPVLVGARWHPSRRPSNRAPENERRVILPGARLRRVLAQAFANRQQRWERTEAVVLGSWSQSSSDKSRSEAFDACRTSRPIIWFAIFLPKETPSAIAHKLQRAIATVEHLPAVQERLKDIGAGPIAAERQTPEYLTAFVEWEVAKWAAPIRASGIRID